MTGKHPALRVARETVGGRYGVVAGRPQGAQARSRDWLLGQLPMGMVEDDFLARFVSIFQEVGSSLVAGADNIENIVDVTVAPPDLVRWLGSWIGAPALDGSLDEARLRTLVRAGSRTLAYRATQRGLADYLEAVTGGPVQVDDSGGVVGEGEAGFSYPFVSVKTATTGGLTDRDFFALIESEVPANVGLEVIVADRRLPGSASDPARPQPARAEPETANEDGEPGQDRL